jgi:8-oxo-dGTP diphosphatase
MADGSGVVLTADVVLFTKRDGVLAVLVVERAKEPFRGALALPGGFVEPGERAADAAARELAEEAGIVVRRDRLRRFGFYRKRGRDPRGAVESVAFHAYLAGAPEVTGGGDARAARWVTLAEFFGSDTVVAFDHREIVAGAITHRFGFQPRMESLGGGMSSCS